MSIAVSPVKRFKSGNLFVNMTSITVSADDKYPNPGGAVVGGYSLTPAQLGLNVVHGAICESSSGYKFLYDTVNQKLKAFEFPGPAQAGDPAPGTELANEDEGLRAAIIHIVAMGR